MASFSIPSWIKQWNRRIHIYLGLYMLFFLGTFAISGLFLNHAQDWFHGKPNLERFTRPVQRPQAADPMEQSRELMAQLGIRGGELIMGPGLPEADRLRFRLHQMSRIITVDADFTKNEAAVVQDGRSWHQFIRDLHVMTGARRAWNDPLPPVRDWWMVKVWSFSLDALAVGFILLVLTSLYMWYQLRQKRLLGAIVLTAGLLGCVYFLWGLRLLL